MFIFIFLPFCTIYSQYYIVGDSQSFQLEKVSKAKVYPNLAKSGIGIKQLISMVQITPVDNKVKVIFVSIGVNDSYIDYGIKNLVDLLYSKFPDSMFFIIRGSYNWGNVKLSKLLIDRYFNYYAKWFSLGINSLNQDIGPGDPHFIKDEYLKIGKEMNYIIQKSELN